MIRAGILTLAILALPMTAAAHCGSSQGSFSLNCESGVKVYRHNAQSSLPAGPTAAQTQLNIAKLRQQTAEKRIRAERNAQAEQADLRAQEIENERYRNRILQHDRARRSGRFSSGFGFGSGQYYGGGYSLGRAVNVRKID